MVSPSLPGALSSIETCVYCPPSSLPGALSSFEPCCPMESSRAEPSWDSCRTEPTSNPVGNTVASQAVSIIGLVKPLDFDWVAGNSSPAGFPESFVGDEYRYGG